MSKEIRNFPKKIIDLYDEMLKKTFNPCISMAKETHLQLFWIEVFLKGQSFNYSKMARASALSEFLAQEKLSLKSLQKVVLELNELLKKIEKTSLEAHLIEYQLKVALFLTSSTDTIQAICRLKPKDIHPSVVATIAANNKKEAKAIDQEDLVKAILLACFYPLRQTVGSCFAAAFMILLQRENLQVFIEELLSLLSKGHLKRVIEGKEFYVPFNVFLQPSEEQFDNRLIALLQNELSSRKLPLVDFSFFNPPYLLKSYEYTIASMTEFSVDSHTGNLFLALGIDPEVKDGLGHKMKNLIETEIQELKIEVEKAHIEAQKSLDVVNMTNSQMQQATSYERLNSLKAQGYSFESQMNAAIERRDLLVKEMEEMSSFLQVWIDKVLELAKGFFQETFNPNLKKEALTFEDSPAGFTMMCKHGRQNIKAWTLIESSKDYILCLKEFFLFLERGLLETFKSSKMASFLHKITALSIDFIHDERFEDHALLRLKKASSNYTYLNCYSYLSGGTLKSVLGCFTGKSNLLKEVLFKPKDALELLVKLIDFMKDSPNKLQERFMKDPNRGLLMQSETHAFIFKPGHSSMKEFWIDTNFSYSKIRDEFIRPLERFFSNYTFDLAEQIHFCSYFFETFGFDLKIDVVKPLDIRAFFKKAALASSLTEQKFMGAFYQFFKKAAFDFPKKSEIIFADTNWPYFNFAFLMNPINHQIEIWRLSFDENEILPMLEWEDQFSQKHGWVLFLETLDQLHFSSIEMLKMFHRV